MPAKVRCVSKPMSYKAQPVTVRETPALAPLVLGACSYTPDLCLLKYLLHPSSSIVFLFARR